MGGSPMVSNRIMALMREPVLHVGQIATRAEVWEDTLALAEARGLPARAAQVVAQWAALTRPACRRAGNTGFVTMRGRAR